MSQPVKLSDALILQARVSGASMERSIAGQVEFWARLGQSMERLMTGAQLGDLRRQPSATSLARRLETINEPEGKQRFANYMASKPFPRFTAHPDEARIFIREDADGTQTVGRFKGREFVPVKIERSETLG